MSDAPDKLKLASACMSYRHDFGLLDCAQRESVMFEAAEWLSALRKAGLVGSAASSPSPAYLAGLEKALRQLSTAACFGSGEVLGQNLENSAMGREVLARMEYARAALASRHASPDVRVVTVEQLELWAKMLEKPLYFKEHAAEIRVIIGGQP